jgi:sulfur carrier protein
VNATITVNGESLPCSGQTLLELLGSLGIPPDRKGIAIAVNATIEPRERWEERHLSPGDKVEIVQPLAGGRLTPPIRSRCGCSRVYEKA